MDLEFFMRDLVIFMNVSGLFLEINLVVSDYLVNFWMFFEVVVSKGGYEMVMRR